MMQKPVFFFTLLFACLMLTTSVVATQEAAPNLDPQAYLPLMAKHDPHRAALMALYHSTDGPNWYHNEGWGGSGSSCNWYGVHCGEAGQVTWLDLGYNQLSGPIPAEFGNLSNLQLLKLHNNQLSGPIPEGLLGVCGLNLSNNNLSGSIPPYMGNIHKDKYYDHNDMSTSPPPSCWLDLSNNNLSGSIPATLANLGDLFLLYMNENPGLICWETVAARDWFVSLYRWSGPTAVCT